MSKLPEKDIANVVIQYSLQPTGTCRQYSAISCRSFVSELSDKGIASVVTHYRYMQYSAISCHSFVSDSELADKGIAIVVIQCRYTCM